MTKNLNYSPHHDLHLWYYGDIYDGVQYVFKFDNGYGASVIKFKGSYGHLDDLWELAVIRFDGENFWNIVYHTDITDDVIGNLTDDGVNKLLERIQNLDENGKETINDD